MALKKDELIVRTFALKKQPFDASNPEHTRLLKQHVAEFNSHYNWLVGDVTVAGGAGVVGFIANLFSWIPFMSAPSALIWAVFGVAVGRGTADNSAYRAQLERMSDLFNWVIPEGKALPNMQCAELQQFILTVGPFISQKKLKRLESYAKQSGSDASVLNKVGMFAWSGVKWAYNAATGNTATSSQSIPDAEFRKMVDKLLKGTGRNQVTDFLLGEGAVTKMAGKATELATDVLGSGVAKKGQVIVANAVKDFMTRGYEAESQQGHRP